MENMQYHKTQHSVYKLNYHLVLVTKYRQKIIDEKIAKTISEVLIQSGKNYSLEIISYNYEADHIHVLFSIHPNTNIQKLVNAIKASTSRLVKTKYPYIKNKLWESSFWTRGYFITTTSEVSTNIIKEYIKNQGID